MYVNKTSDWVSLSEGAQLLGCSERTLRRRVASGEIPGYRFGSRVIRLRLSDLNDAMRPIPAAAG
jgi:excisionase family DNA binding protein